MSRLNYNVILTLIFSILHIIHGADMRGLQVIQSVTAFVLASMRSVNVIIFHMHSTAGLDATFADFVKNFVTVSTCYIHTPL